MVNVKDYFYLLNRDIILSDVQASEIEKTPPETGNLLRKIKIVFCKGGVSRIGADRCGTGIKVFKR
jgi:hypothetical protein